MNREEKTMYLLLWSRWLFLLVLLLMILAVYAGASPQVSAVTPPIVVQQDITVPENAPAWELVDRGDLLRARKDYAAALRFYRAALKKAPKDGEIWNRIGMTNLHFGQYDEARMNFERAVKYNPKYAEAYNNLGVAHYIRKDYNKAIKQYRKSLALDESFASVHSNLAAAYFSQRKFNDAMREYARAYEIDPDVFERSSQTGVTAHLASPEDRGRYAYVLAKLYAKAGDCDRSLAQLKKAKEHGYPKLKDVYRDEEFAVVRKHPRFADVMGATTGPES